MAKHTKPETPAALPQLTRILPLEFKVRKAPKPTPESVRLLTENFEGQTFASDEDKKREWRGLVKLAKRFEITIAPAASPEVTAWRAAAEAEPDPDDPNEIEEDERDGDVFEMSFSSETPVPRWFGDEILDHSAECVDMTRAANGLAYLVDHNTGDQVGIITNVRVEGKRLRGDVRFSRSQRGQDIKRDVQDGIRPFVSVGYRVMELVLEKETESDDGVQRTYRVTRWMPMEGSTVAVPADVSVGPGRSADAREFPIQFRSAIPTPAPPAPTIEVRTMNPKQTASVMRLCQTHGVDQKRAMEIIETEGMTEERAASLILEDVAKRNGGTKPVETPGAESSMLTLTDRESREYNLCRGVMTHVRNMEDNRNDKSFETEVSDEIAKRNKDGKNHGGLFVPWRLQIDPSQVRSAVERFGVEALTRTGVATALAVKTSTQGSELVFTEPGPFIQFLYNRMRLKELGAATMSGLQGNVGFPKQTGKASGSWVGENPGTDVADSNLTLSQVPLSPKTYQSSAAYSRQLLAQAVIDIDNLVRADLATDCALAIDLAGISGTGSSDDPKGILHTTGVQDYTLAGDTGGNGAKPTWDDITIMEEMLEDVNADQLGDFAWLTTPGIKGLFKRTPRLVYTPAGTGTTVNVTGDPIWSDDDEIDGYMARSSNQVPKTLTAGTSHDCHALIVGVFGALINGLWGSGFELVVDPYRLKKQGLIELTTFILTDWANRYPVAFVAAQDAKRA